jgi:prephenate dehydrogenase
MEEPDFSQLRVAIFGLGLIGGSLALCLRGRVRELRAADPDARRRELALEMGIVDVAASDGAEILNGIDLMVLAAPVRVNLELVKALPQLMPEGEAVVLDLGSTKATICEAYAGLPERFDPVGGHPMGGKERGGLENAEAAIFHSATFALVALPRTSVRAQAVAEGLALLLGSRPVWMEAETHDRWAAATSHLPYLLANALALATPVEARTLVGPGFRSTSRLAGGFTPMMLDVLLSNRENVLEAVGRFRRELDALETALRQEDERALRARLERSAQQHNELLEMSMGSEASA